MTARIKDGLSAIQPKPSQFTTLFDFKDSKTGEADVEGALTVVDGSLYGAATSGGSAGLGTVFQLDLASFKETALTSFTGGKTQGAVPFGPVAHVATTPRMARSGGSMRIAGR